ncbi:hypothetical protein BKA65DRAFT_579780 [Rhexocercosporidium sp. MPI-PUGE-AT-0058]|nr:hypothetical protein BKA65DRAFT_579780 [Rhexocercosporidium sp. MPI-PUGE-AT-0058]
MSHRIESPDLESAYDRPASEGYTSNTNELQRTETMSSSNSMPELIDMRDWGSEVYTSDGYLEIDDVLNRNLRSGPSSSSEDAPLAAAERRREWGNAEIVREAFMFPNGDESMSGIGRNTFGDEAPTSRNQVFVNLELHLSGLVVRNTVEDMREYMRSNGIFGDAEVMHRWFWNTDYGMPGSRREQAQVQRQSQTGSPRPGLVRGMAHSQLPDAPPVYQLEDPQSQIRVSRPGLVRSIAYNPGEYMFALTTPQEGTRGLGQEDQWRQVNADMFATPRQYPNDHQEQMETDPDDPARIVAAGTFHYDPDDPLADYSNIIDLYLDYLGTHDNQESASFTNSDEGRINSISANMTGGSTQPSRKRSAFEQEMWKRFISHCEEYGGILQRHCRSLQWKIDARPTSHHQVALENPSLESLKDIGSDMLSKDPVRLNDAAQAYAAFMRAYTVNSISYHESVTQDQSEFPMLKEFCQLLQLRWFLEVGSGWRECIKLHTGCDTMGILVMRRAEVLGLISAGNARQS